jgi:hypothetical protein
MFPYRNSVRRNIEVAYLSLLCVPAIPLDDALSLPESESKVVKKFDNLPNFAIL